MNQTEQMNPAEAMNRTEPSLAGSSEPSVLDGPSVLDQVRRHRVVPVVVLQDARQAAPLARVLVSGGLPIAEVTFRTPAAAAALRELAANSDLLVGAGTVIRPEQVDAAAQAGARFVVTPGLSADVVRRCRDLGLPVIPGVATATEIIAALDLDLDVVKLFPAGQLGGLAMLAALAAPFPSVRFVPTGGITEQSAADYLVHPAVLAVGGSWMVPSALVSAGRWDEVERLVTRTVAAARLEQARPDQEGASR